MTTLTRVITTVFLLLTLTACGEQIASTRLPSGAGRNFFTHLQQGELEDALTYWAPVSTPTDARTRTIAALTRLRGYETEVIKTDSMPNADGSQDVILRGRVRAQGGTWQEDQELMRSHLIMRGPGWRLTDFSLTCCQP